ncbi:MAG: DUF924 family protein [Brevundimonas sp.]|nr:MAG: DUF924 family protein [Brevundimonas sp.]
MSTDLTPSDVVGFWKEAGPKMWFAKDDAFDDLFRQRFAHGHMMAARRELDHWAETPEGSLALLILLDQFPRNAFRGTAHQFATDPLARHFAVQAADAGQDRLMGAELQSFFYLPFEHSEDIRDQDRAVALYDAGPGDEGGWAAKHRDVIRRFGRFPHRNRALGRETTPDEQAFLDGGGFGG